MEDPSQLANLNQEPKPSQTCIDPVKEPIQKSYIQQKQTSNSDELETYDIVSTSVEEGGSKN